MYQSSPELLRLQQEQASVEQKLKQLQHKQRRLENRKKRTHRLCSIAGTIESIAPNIKLLTLPEVNELMEHIFCLPNVQSAIYHAKMEHEKREKEELPIGPVSFERHTN